MIWQIVLFNCLPGRDMEVTKEHVRLYIYTRYKLGIRERSIHEEIVKIYCNHAPSFRTIARWIQYFADGGERMLKMKYVLGDQRRRGPTVQRKEQRRQLEKTHL
jgi:hypothetical protein